MNIQTEIKQVLTKAITEVIEGFTNKEIISLMQSDLVDFKAGTNNAE